MVKSKTESEAGRWDRAKRGAALCRENKNPGGDMPAGVSKSHLITREGTSRPSRAGKALCVVMVVEIHCEVAKKAGKTDRGKFFPDAAGTPSPNPVGHKRQGRPGPAR